MRARYLLPALATLALSWTLPASGQQTAGLESARSAKAEAYMTAGTTRDARGGEVVAQAIFVKLRKGTVDGTPWGTAAALASRAGIGTATATARPFANLPVDKGLSSRLQSLPSAQRARVAAAQDELSRIVEVRYTARISPGEAARRIMRMPQVEYAEPIPVVMPLAPPVVPNDPRINEQTHLTQIKAFDAWGIWQGDTNMVIGVVDAGIDRFHEDLAPNIKPNLDEYGVDKDGNRKETNRIDDDKNGVVDDYLGANLTAAIDTSTPGDTRGINHGTVVAGLAAAATNNSLGIAGSGNRCRFFPVKAALKQGGNLIFAYDGIEYCARRGMKVINCSFGAEVGSQMLQDYITNLVTAFDVAIVAGAGNTPAYRSFFPAGYKHVLGVGAIDNNNILGTTWGEQVGVSAPSNLSTNDANGYTQAGVYTSFATPVVAGVVALVRSKWPTLTADQALAHVRLSGDNIDVANQGKEKLIGYGRVNAHRAVAVDPFAHPSIEIDSLWLTDTDNSPRTNFAVNDEGKLHVRLRNILGPATNIKVRVRLYTEDTAFYSFGSEEITLASLPTGQVGTPAEGISFKVKKASASRVKLRFDLTADGSYQDYKFDRAVIYHPYITAETPQVSISLTSSGRLGYEDYPDNKVGDGVYYDGVPFLFEGGFLYASDRYHVISNIRDGDPDKQQQDFATVESPDAENNFTLTLNDSKAHIDRKIGLEMRMRVITSDLIENAYAIEVRTKNMSGATIDSLRIGMFNDWDIDSTEYGQRITYTSSPGQPVPFHGRIGTSFDYQIASGVAAPAPIPIFYAIQNDRPPINIFDGFSLDKKWHVLSNGVGSQTAGSLNVRDSLDVSLITGRRIDNFAAGAEDTTVFVVGFGYSVQEAVQAMQDLAPRRTSSVVEEVAGSRALLGAARPNPFNSTTRFVVRGVAGATLRIFDAFGRQVADLTGMMPPAGARAEIPFDGSFLASGTYYVRLSSAEGTDSEPLLLAR